MRGTLSTAPRRVHVARSDGRSDPRLRRAKPNVHVFLWCALTLCFAVAGCVVGGRRHASPTYVPPPESEPHANVKLRLVYHASPGQPRPDDRGRESERGRPATSSVGERKHDRGTRSPCAHVGIAWGGLLRARRPEHREAVPRRACLPRPLRCRNLGPSKSGGVVSRAIRFLWSSVVHGELQETNFRSRRSDVRAVSVIASLVTDALVPSLRDSQGVKIR
jgi:hypothetical protein